MPRHATACHAPPGPASPRRSAKRIHTDVYAARPQLGRPFCRGSVVVLPCKQTTKGPPHEHRTPPRGRAPRTLPLGALLRSEGGLMTDSPVKRHAVIRGHGHDKLETIRRYMPSNYSADSDGGDIWISGTDNAGWTLDAYVIPRLASGLYFAKEVVPMPGLTAKRTARVTELGETVLREAGADACQEGYGTTDPFFVGHNALGFGDITEDGELT